MKLLSFVLVALTISIAAQTVHAQSISGKVTDENGEPLHSATVYLDGTTIGTIANEDGKFHLKMTAGQHTLVVKYIGYATIKEEVTVNGNIVKNYQMAPEAVELEEVFITSDGKDPAYAIIQKAIDNKKKNRLPFESYSYTTYTKTVLRNVTSRDTSVSTKSLELLFGADGDELDSIKTDEEEIVYLEENVTEVFVAKPNRQKENVISTQVSGEKGTYSFVGNMINKLMEFSPYDNLVKFEGISTRGIVSPIANSAMIFYDYKLLGSVVGQHGKSYKIQVIPKRKFDPVFSGIIYIVEGSYAVKSTDLIVSKYNQISLFDTLRIQQNYVQVKDSAWAPMGRLYSGKIPFDFGAFAFRLNLSTENVTREYDFEWQAEKGFFSNEVISFADSAADRDSTWWKELRPVPLKEDEERDYQYKDSIRLIQHSPEYLDSVSRAQNKFHLNRFFLGGYKNYNRRTKTSWNIDAPFGKISFNPMEGWHFGLGAGYGRKLYKNGRLGIRTALRYGTASKKFGYSLGTKFSFGRNNPLIFDLEGGDYVKEFSPMSQISTTMNFLYSAYAKKNYLAYYQRKFLAVNAEKKLIHGLKVKVSSIWEDRTAMPVMSQWDLIKTDDLYAENFLFNRHQAFTIGGEAEITPGIKYIKTPDSKMELGTKWPTLRIGYQRAVTGINGSDISYEKVSAGISKVHTMGLLGTFSWDVSGGTFLSNNVVALPDRQHFKGNRTFLRNAGLRQFHIMDYYSYATNDSWLEAHAQHAFGGFILNKIPLLKNLRLQEYVGLHFLWTEEYGEYLELQVGLEKRIIRGLLPLRFDFHYRMLGVSTPKWGITFTWPFGSDGQLSIGN